MKRFLIEILVLAVMTGMLSYLLLRCWDAECTLREKRIMQYQMELAK